ncbi:MAG: PKD domain-containing protein [Saprospiraceae bacterium]|nr:PKD domain-containing protein [Saprospiraceae bacterium]
MTTYGEIVFSPDGSSLARFDAKDDLFLFDFDRCTGMLSNPLHIPITDDSDNENYAGLAFSADGRYLYAAEVKRLLQFDMQAADIAASQTLVAERILNPDCALGQGIVFLELAPDGRIYCRPPNGQRCMHRLAQPELPGPAAQLEQYYYRFDFAYKNLPHFPNFRLGPLDGSPCDTLGLDNHPLANWRYDRTGGLGVDFTSVSWYEPTLWQWDFGDPPSGAANNSAERNPQHTFSAPGAYEVCLTVSNAYGSDTKCKTVWVLATGAGEPKEGVEAARVYPNPTTGLVFFTNVEAGAIAEVYNQLGQLQLRQNLTDARLDLGLLPNGVYVVRLIREGQAPVTRSVVLNKN